ncbi:MAG: hypothetical protein ACFB9M_17845 [Myxococcota bacterium]
MRSLLSLASLTLMAFLFSACGSIKSDFDETIDFTAEIVDDEALYNDFELFDPNDNEDFRDNKDDIEDGQIRRITITILETFPFDPVLPHQADVGVGQIDIRAAPEDAEVPPAEGFEPNQLDEIPGDPFIQAVGRFDPVTLVPGESFDLDLNEEVLAEVHELLFDRAGPMEVRFFGLANDGPVNFTFEVEILVTFKAVVF